MLKEINFSIIIPAFNEALHIKECIKSVRANKPGTFEDEIVVVDNGSTDNTTDIARALGVNVIENSDGKRKSISALRNTGARQAGGDILVFLDADMIVPDNWLIKAREYFAGGFEGVLGFVERTPLSAGWVGKVWSERRYLKRNREMDVDFLPGRNLFVDRGVFESVNGFDESLKTCEDKDFTVRVLQAGYRVVSLPRVTVVHLGYEKDIWQFLKKEYWRQESTLQFARKQGFSPRTLRNPLLSIWHLLVMASMIVLSFSIGPGTALFAMMLWILPSLVITFAEVGFRMPFVFFGQLCLLTFLRWNVSGLALISQLISHTFQREV